MGVFPLSAPNIPKIVPINMISYVGSYDPWVIPFPSEIESLGDTMPLSPTKLSYYVMKPCSKSCPYLNDLGKIHIIAHPFLLVQ